MFCSVVLCKPTLLWWLPGLVHTVAPRGCSLLAPDRGLNLFLLGRTSETPTTTTSHKSIAIRLPFVLQYASNLYCSSFGAPMLRGKGVLSVLLPFVSQYAPHLYCNTPPICIAVLLGKSWWLWSLGCSPLTGDVGTCGQTQAFRLGPPPPTPPKNRYI